MLGNKPVALLVAALLTCLSAFIASVAAEAAAGPTEQKTTEAKSPTTRPVRLKTLSVRRGPATRPSVENRRSVGLTAEQEKSTLAFLQKRRPTYHRNLLELKKADGRRYALAIRKMYSFMKRWQQMPEAIRQATEAEREHQLSIMAVVRRIRQAKSDADKDALQEELRQAISDHFEAERELRARRLQHLDDQIQQLRQELMEQQRQRDQTIKERLALWMRATKPVPSPFKAIEK